MGRLAVAARVAGYLARQRGVRRAALRVAVVALGAGLLWRACAHRSAGSDVPPTEAAPAPQVHAFCKRFDPKAIYVWGETLEGSTYTRAIAELDAPDVYCQLPSRSTFLPSIRPDRRLMFMRDFGKDGERAYLYDASGGDGEKIETPQCTTRFSWLRYSDRHLYYGCQYWEYYDKEWLPIFYRDAASVIGYGKGVERVFGDPSDGSVVALTRDGLSVVDVGRNEVKKVTGLPRLPDLVRATSKGFLALTQTGYGEDARLWRIDRDGAVTLDRELAALPPSSVHAALAMTSDGDVYEYLPGRTKDDANTVVLRTRTTTRTVYSDAEWKKRGKPFVRLDTKNAWGRGVVTSR